jgi:C_GCAxxG_C_C family probable redox protein
MSNAERLSKKAAAYFLGGYNCAESVLLTMCEHWNGENNLVPKIATGFGGGIGRCGAVCGALVGGVMAIGIKYGFNELGKDKRWKPYDLAQRFYKQFEKKHGSVLCRELIGYDLSDPEELEKVRKAGIFEKKCADFVKTAIQSLIEFDEGQC